MNRPILVVKVGGSLLTDRSVVATPIPAQIARFGGIFRAATAQYHGTIIVVIGGGSFGHASSPSFGSEAVDIEALHELFALWAKMVAVGLSENGYRCRAVTADQIGRGGISDALQSDCRSEHLIFLGGICRGRRIRIVSSDLVAAEIAMRLRAERLLHLSRAGGVVSSGRTIGLVRRENRLELLRATGPSEYPDSTGGMRRKVTTLLRASRGGVTCSIADGSSTDMVVLEEIMGARSRGTVILPL